MSFLTLAKESTVKGICYMQVNKKRKNLSLHLIWIIEDSYSILSYWSLKIQLSHLFINNSNFTSSKEITFILILILQQHYMFLLIMDIAESLISTHLIILKIIFHKTSNLPVRLLTSLGTYIARAHNQISYFHQIYQNSCIMIKGSSNS